MSTAFYSDMQGLASSMIAEFGVPVTLRKKSAPGTYDAATQQVTGASTETDYTVNGVLIPNSLTPIDGKHFQYNDEFHGGTNIEKNVTTFFLDANQTNGTALPAPDLDDKIISADGVQFVIMGVTTLRPATTTCYYEVNCVR